MQITIIKKKNYKNFTLIYKNQKMYAGNYPHCSELVSVYLILSRYVLRKAHYLLG